MLLRILGKSLARRRGRIAFAVISVVMGAAVITALLAVSMDVEEQVAADFRKYGANLVIVPQSDTIEVGFPGVTFGSVTEQGYIEEEDVWRIMRISWRTNILGFAPFLYSVVHADSETASQDVVLAGTYFDRDVEILDRYSSSDPEAITTGVSVINAWWLSKGKWIDRSDDYRSALVGVNVADKMGLKIGDTFTISFKTNGDGNLTTSEITVVGLVETGGNEDNQVMVNLQLAQDMTNRTGKVHTIQVSALCTGCPVDTFAEEIEGEIDYVEARTVKQLVSAEMSMLGKFEGMMAMVTMVAMAASVLGVTTTMTTSVIERQKEIGLMKSVGAERRKISLLFLSEAAVIGTIGGVLGFVAGVFLARSIGLSVFDTAVSTNILLLPVAIGISVAVAVGASILPVRRAQAVEPAVVLRGE
ncbi:MAG: FtsX-like permease family protein [Thermoplasmata archaeon]|nr:FtsX-like permease family protein [Thermoplasmata archaeon]